MPEERERGREKERETAIYSYIDIRGHAYRKTNR